MNMEHPRRRPIRWPGVVAAAAGLAALLSMGACAGGSATSTGAVAGVPAAAASTAASAGSNPSTAATPATASARTTHRATSTGRSTAATMARSSTPGYADARAQWQQGAKAISAEQGAYWLKAASYLQAGEGTDSGDTSAYPNAVKELKDLASLPDAQQTAAQNAEFHADIDALDSFFATPGLYS